MNHDESRVIFKITIKDLLMIILLLNNSLPKYRTHFIVNGSWTLVDYIILMVLYYDSTHGSFYHPSRLYFHIEHRLDRLEVIGLGHSNSLVVL